MSDPGFAVAFLGGLLALLSPCSALLLPAFFAYSFTGRTRLLGRTVLFYAGLCLTMVPLGVAGSLAGRLFYGHRDLLVLVGGWLVIALGLVQALGLGFGSRRMQQLAGARRSGSALSVAALGAVYGLAGFCAGPILGSVLTVAAMGGDPWRGGALLAVYALGMAVPMFVLAACGTGSTWAGVAGCADGRCGWGRCGRTRPRWWAGRCSSPWARSSSSSTAPRRCRRRWAWTPSSPGSGVCPGWGTRFPTACCWARSPWSWRPGP